MSDPVLHLLAGPNGAGKTTLFDRVLGPATQLPFVNADRIAAERWPGDESAHGHDASNLAATLRDQLLGARASFVAETVFSHGSKLELVTQAGDLGYRVVLHVVMVPEELSIARVPERVRNGGHDVPVEKIRARWHRLWPLVASAVRHAAETHIYDNTSARHPYRPVAQFVLGLPVGQIVWPGWTPSEIVALTP